jgi:capsular polysaccharide biosynthesis protein/GGDEF domain-containing protein
MVRLRIYLQSLWRNWWIVALTALAAVGATLLLNALAQPVYQTGLQLLIVPNMTDFDGRDLIYSLDTLDRRSIVATYVEVVNSNRIRREALDGAALAAPERGNYEISAVALPEASILEVVVTGPDPEVVVALANAAGEGTINYVSQTYDIYRLEMLDPAPVPATPISPTPWRDAFLALIIGLVLGGILAILRDQMRAPITETLRQWNGRDPVSTAYKRPYLEHELGQLLPVEGPQLVIGVVRLEGLSQLDLPAPMWRDLQRRIVNIMREELAGRDLIGQWHDHSYAIIIRHVNSLEEARNKLARLQQELSQPIELYPGGEVVNLLPRMGAVLGRENDTVSSLMERLTTAGRQAEKNGREPVLYQQAPTNTTAPPREEIRT